MTVAGFPDNGSSLKLHRFSVDAISYFLKIHDILSNEEQVSEEEDWKSLEI